MVIGKIPVKAGGVSIGLVKGFVNIPEQKKEGMSKSCRIDC